MKKWNAKNEKTRNNGVLIQELWNETYMATFSGVIVMVYPLGLMSYASPTEAILILKVQLGLMIGTMAAYTIAIKLLTSNNGFKEKFKKLLESIVYNDPEFLRFLKRGNYVYKEPLSQMDVTARRAHMMCFLTKKNSLEEKKVGIMSTFVIVIILLSVLGCIMSFIAIGKNASGAETLMAMLPKVMGGILMYLLLWATANRMMKNFSLKFQAEVSIQEVETS